ncbi:hypothetical protein [Roseibium sp.]|uniref:hypothetical protein n=1 Tax=Roseibium sp. TaxID=1936156 RepID=UPI003A98032A
MTQHSQTVGEFLGDSVADTIPQVLMSTAHAQAGRCWNIAISRQHDWLVREAFLRCWTYLALMGEVSRVEATKMLRSFPKDGGLPADSFLWTGWLTAIADLGLDQLVPVVEETIATGQLEMNSLAILSSDIDVFYNDLHEANSVQRTPEEFTKWKLRKRYTPFSEAYEDFFRAARHVISGVNSTAAAGLRAAEDPNVFDSF